MIKTKQTEIVIVGSGAAGLYCALNLPRDKQILLVTKDKASRSDSYLAQGGICVLRDEEDFTDFYEDTMRAGHYENNPDSVEIMIRSSKAVISDLVTLGVEFEKEGEEFSYTREGAHSKPRILFHEDETGREITSRLLSAVLCRENITVVENYTMVDLICDKDRCCGIIGHDEQEEYSAIVADYTVLATGGVGGLYRHSTNYRHLTGDSLALAIKYGIELKHIDYIQIHPTALYTEREGRKFLISESVRGEGAVLLNSAGERFVDELLPRDVVANAIFAEMEREGSKHVWLSLAAIPEEEIRSHFPNIYEHCLKEGYDITKEPIPVVPSQHYFMGGIAVDYYSKTSMERLYAVGETACNGVHGRNRLASNSLLESLVFAKRAAQQMGRDYLPLTQVPTVTASSEDYRGYREHYKQLVLDAIEKEKNSHE
ncbi:MAG: L-aspartate oxidase [Oscillospiraceae bacterium]|nr:L-aspartate oxidase [Oscillospiraceae bacterium]